MIIIGESLLVCCWDAVLVLSPFRTETHDAGSSVWLWSGVVTYYRGTRPKHRSDNKYFSLSLSTSLDKALISATYTPTLTREMALSRRLASRDESNSYLCQSPTTPTHWCVGSNPTEIGTATATPSLRVVRYNRFNNSPLARGFASSLSWDNVQSFCIQSVVTEVPF
jgi:hypothetical protein